MFECIKYLHDGKIRMNSVISENVEWFKYITKNGGHASSPLSEIDIKPFYFLKKTKEGIQASNADGQCPVARRLSEILGVKQWTDHVSSGNRFLVTPKGEAAKKPYAGQTCGAEFEKLIKVFIEQTFVQHLGFMRSGQFSVVPGCDLKAFEQYRHLKDFDDVLTHIPDSAKDLRDRLDAAFSSYAVKPDVLVVSDKLDRDKFNREWMASDPKRVLPLLSPEVATKTNLFISGSKGGNRQNIHAIVSAKWTIRSDRAQNARTEGAFASQQRRGKAPHFVVVTAEPKPSRIRSLALGSEIDCVYHAFLPELKQSLEEISKNGDLKQKGNDKTEMDWFEILMEMNRLRDISDLPFDLVL
ncbi:NgoMIV family type II restriction endonuclease [Desulfovibrio caledoniensis]